MKTCSLIVTVSDISLKKPLKCHLMPPISRENLFRQSVFSWVVRDVIESDCCPKF